MIPLDAIEKVWATASKLKELSDKVKEADIRMAIADLMMSVADLKVEIAALKEENLHLKKKIDGQDDWERIRKDLHLEGGVCTYKGQDKQPGPYCGRCAEVEKKLIPLGNMPRAVRDMYRYSCPNCKAHF